MNSLRKSDPEILSSLLEEIKNLKVHTDKRYGKARKKPLLVLLIVAKIARKEIIQNQFYFRDLLQISTVDIMIYP